MLIATLPQYLPYEMVYVQSAYTLGSQYLGYERGLIMETQEVW